MLAADVENVPKSDLDTAMKDLGDNIDPIAQHFQEVIDEQVQQSLVPSVKIGAQKASSIASSTVNSWGSKCRRSRHERGPEKNGLHWQTYNAVAMRDGVYTSRTNGAIDLNRELCDPMEKE